jgi:hypothetical protein
MAAGRLLPAGFDLEQDATFRMFADIDQAVEWCEDQIIKRETPACSSEEPISIRSMLRRQLASDLDVEAFITFLSREEFAAGDYLIHQGERLTDMFFLESGRVRVALELADLHTSSSLHPSGRRGRRDRRLPRRGPHRLGD